MVSHFAQSRVDGADFIRAVDRAFQYETRVRLPCPQRSDGDSVESERRSIMNAITGLTSSNVKNLSCSTAAGHSFHALPAKPPPAQPYSQVPAPVPQPAPPQYFPVPKGSAMADALTAFGVSYVKYPNILPLPPPPTPYIMHQTQGSSMVYQQPPHPHYINPAITTHSTTPYHGADASSRSLDTHRAQRLPMYLRSGAPTVGARRYHDNSNSNSNFTHPAYDMRASAYPPLPTLSYPEPDQYLPMTDLRLNQGLHPGPSYHGPGSNIRARAFAPALEHGEGWGLEFSFGQGRDRGEGRGRVYDDTRNRRRQRGYRSVGSGRGRGAYRGIGHEERTVQDVSNNHRARGDMGHDGADDNREVPAAPSSHVSVSEAPSTYYRIRRPSEVAKHVSLTKNLDDEDHLSKFRRPHKRGFSC